MERWNRGWCERNGLQHYFMDGYSLCERFLQQMLAVDVMDVEHGGYTCARSDPTFCQECVELWKDLRISEGDKLPCKEASG